MAEAAMAVVRGDTRTVDVMDVTVSVGIFFFSQLWIHVQGNMSEDRLFCLDHAGWLLKILYNARILFWKTWRNLYEVRNSRRLLQMDMII